MHVSYQYIGVTGYAAALQLMENKIPAAVQQKKAFFLGLQHPLVYTCGLKTSDSHVLDPALPLVMARRGGSITLHNPGQLVFYTVLPLEQSPGLAAWIRLIEQAIAQTLALWQIDSHLNPPHSGVFRPEGKIAFVGLGLKKKAIYHGAAINLFNHLPDYQGILSCGLTLPMTSVAMTDTATGAWLRQANALQKELFLMQFSDQLASLLQKALET